uniref:Protein FMC1 homolog n=1 Tax=Macrostomum lignano TaxID=282301 RepID=A0A1I8FMJ0_9PLAT
MLLKTRKIQRVRLSSRSRSVSQLRSRRRAVPASHEQRDRTARGGGGGGRPGQLALVLEEEEPPADCRETCAYQKAASLIHHAALFGDVIQVQQKQFNSSACRMYQLMAQDVADHMRRRQQLHRLRRERQTVGEHVARQCVYNY